MGKGETKQIIVMACLGAIIFALPDGKAFAAADGCPQAAPKLKNPDCSESKKAGKEKEDACKKCQDTIKEQDKKMSDWKNAKQQCDGVNSACPATQTSGGGDTQKGGMSNDKGNADAAKSCFQQKGSSAQKAAKLGKDCKDKISSDCTGLEGQDQEDADKSKKACDDAAKDADKAAKDDSKKADDAGKKGDQSKDNAKKEDSAPPQMPEMPKMPEDKKQDPPPTDSAPATSPTPADSSVAIASPPTPESSNFADSPANGVVFGETGTATSVSTIAPNGTPGFGSGSSFVAPHDTAASRPLGDTGMAANSGGATGGGAGGSAGAAGNLNTAGASAAGEPVKAETNPYEVNAGSGGKLGGPKGSKSGGESDSVLDASASANFDKDFKGDKGHEQGSDSGATAEDPDTGFTLFKMVKIRYSELKRQGNI